MTIFELADKLDRISTGIEEIYDLTGLLQSGLFNGAPLDEDWKCRVFCDGLHHYDALLSAIRRSIAQKEREISELSKTLCAISRANKAVSA